MCVIAGFRCPLEIRWSPPCAAGRTSRYEITRPRVLSSACSRTLNWPARSGVARRAQEPQTARAHRADDLPEPAASDCARDRGTAPPGQVFGLSPANRERGHETSDSAASGVPRPTSLQLPGGAAGVGQPLLAGPGRTRHWREAGSRSRTSTDSIPRESPAIRGRPRCRPGPTSLTGNAESRDGCREPARLLRVSEPGPEFR